MLTRRGLAGLTAGALAGTAGPGRAQAQGAPVKIGVLTDIGGPTSSMTGVPGVDAVRMAIEDFGGKALGRPVEVVSADHQQSNDVGLSIARRWFEREGVTMITCIDSSTMGVAIQSWAAEHPYLTVITAAASSDLTGSACSPVAIHWTHNTYALAVSLVKGLLKLNADTWYFIAVDTNTGATMTRDTSALVTRTGGKVLGVSKHPFQSGDFSAFLLQAGASKAKVVVLANSGSDTINSVKGWSEFGMGRSGSVLAVLGMQPQYVEAVGLPTAQGIVTGLGYFNDLDDATRAFTARFTKRNPGVIPSALAVGNYSGSLHYLKAVESIGSTDPAKVSAAMKAMKVNDAYHKDVTIRQDGRLMNDFYVLQVKTPTESTGPHDVFKLLGVLKGEEVYAPITEQGCRLFPKT